MEIRVDRKGLLIDQLSSSAELSQERLEGLTDEEYLWEPVEGMWSIRKKADAKTSHAYGKGVWVLDLERGGPSPAPVTTIAWRIGHLLSMFAGRWEWTFGQRQTPPEDLVEFTPKAGPALAELWGQTDRWLDRIDQLTDDELEIPGFGQYPHGLDPQIPFIGILWWMNRELIHHLAEVSLLRDLYGKLPPASASSRD